MSEDTLLPFDLPSVARKKLSVGFDGGQLSSDAGVHGHQQLSVFNAHYDERCFLPIHIYDAASGSRWR